jgi:hypothetical protein
MDKLEQENRRMREENFTMGVQNNDIATVIDSSAVEKERRTNQAHDFAMQMTDAEANFAQFDGKERISELNQKALRGETNDLVEYVKWVTLEATTLRKRMRAAD